MKVNFESWEKFVPVGSHTQTSSLSTATSITVLAGATCIMMQTQTQSVRFTLDGTTPTTTKGFLVVANAVPLIVAVKPAQVIKVIEVTTTAVFDYQFGSQV